MAAYQYVYHMDGVSKTYPGGKKCFENIRLSFLPGVKIGVVGVNGSGKSTLLKIMAGLDTDFSGEAWAAQGAKVGYLPQEPKLEDHLTVRENVMLGVKDKKDILDRYNDLAMNYSDETANEMAQLQDEIDAQNLWDLDAQIDVSLEALRCPPDDAMPENLSGGEARRVALCRLLLEQPDMLLLDEPTNHLDIDARQALIEALNGYEGCVILVSHDPHLVEAVADRLYLVKDAGVAAYDGDLEAYRALIMDQRRKERADARKNKKSSKTETSTQRPDSAKADKLETKLGKLTQDKADLESAMSEPDAVADTKKMEKLLAQYATLEKDISETETQWFACQP